MIPEGLRPIQPEPEDVRLLQHIRDWLELNRIERNIRDMKRSNQPKQDGNNG